MTRSIRLSRRTVLRGMLGGAGVALGLPLLDVMLDERGEALANGSPLPTRFGLWWWGAIFAALYAALIYWKVIAENKAVKPLTEPPESDATTA